MDTEKDAATVASYGPQKRPRKRRKVRGIFLKPGKEPGVWWIRWWCNYGHRHEERIGPKGLAEVEVEKRRVMVKTEDYCLGEIKRLQGKATKAH